MRASAIRIRQSEAFVEDVLVEVQNPDGTWLTLGAIHWTIAKSNSRGQMLEAISGEYFAPPFPAPNPKDQCAYDYGQGRPGYTDADRCKIARSAHARGRIPSHAFVECATVASDDNVTTEG